LTQACSSAQPTNSSADPAGSGGPGMSARAFAFEPITPGGSVTGKPSPSTRPTHDTSTQGPAATPPATRAPSSRAPVAPANQPVVTPANTTVYLHYYLWWTPLHWHDKLGNSYPFSARHPPIPGAMDATGCNPTVRYPGATIVDVPSEGLYDQGRGATFDLHIAQAASARIAGFIVSWQGTGQPGQTPASSGYNARLDLLVARVNAYNASHATKFRLALGLEAFGNYARPAAQIINDLEYFRSRYG